MDYRQKILNLNNRYNPEASRQVQERMFSADSIWDSDVIKYVRRAMSPVDVDYTRKTKEAGENVKQHLKEVLFNVSYEYQGSVMTNTHIKGASDIDLLVICEKFYGTDIHKVRQELQNAWKYNYSQRSRLETYNRNFSTYDGNSSSDLADLRCQIEQVMMKKYLKCDTSKAKAVKITNQNLHRDVDIVTSSWFQSLDFVLNGMPDELRGIKIFNKDLGYAEGPDYPFLGIHKINSKDDDSNGKLKRMIRFLKNVRKDSDKDIPLTSFEINAICYSIPIENYKYMNDKDIVSLLWNTMFNLWHDNKHDSLRSVVGDEYVFKGKPDKVEALKKLEDEVYKISHDLNS